MRRGPQFVKRCSTVVEAIGCPRGVHEHCGRPAPIQAFSSVREELRGRRTANGGSFESKRDGAVVLQLIAIGLGRGRRTEVEGREEPRIQLSADILQLSTDVRMVLLDADPFLNELTKLYEGTKESGTVWVTLKRSSLQRQGKRKSEDESPVEESQFRCIVRATDGKKKISTLLSAKEHHRFQMAYATVLKAHMDTLKKREKKDKKATAPKVSGS